MHFYTSAWSNLSVCSVYCRVARRSTSFLIRQWAVNPQQIYSKIKCCTKRRGCCLFCFGHSLQLLEIARFLSFENMLNVLQGFFLWKFIFKRFFLVKVVFCFIFLTILNKLVLRISWCCVKSFLLWIFDFVSFF